MKRLFLYLLSRQTVLVVSVYALLAKLLLTQEAPYVTLVALFLALVGQLGHRALRYYGDVREAVKGAVSTHGTELGAARAALDDHQKRLDVAEKNVARLAQVVEKRGVF